jgi:hypothetical protein
VQTWQARRRQCQTASSNTPNSEVDLIVWNPKTQRNKNTPYASWQITETYSRVLFIEHRSTLDLLSLIIEQAILQLRMLFAKQTLQWRCAILRFSISCKYIAICSIAVGRKTPNSSKKKERRMNWIVNNIPRDRADQIFLNLESRSNRSGQT